MRLSSNMEDKDGDGKRPLMVTESVIALVVALRVRRYRKSGVSGAGTWMDDTTQNTCQFWLLTVPSPSLPCSMFPPLTTHAM